MNKEKSNKCEYNNNSSSSPSNYQYGKNMASNSLELYNSLKDKFKTKYRFHIAIYLGINITLIYGSRDLASIFFSIAEFLQNGEDDKILPLAYLFPNFFLPLFFGYITDYIGYHLGLFSLYIPIILGNLFIMMSTLVGNEKPFNMELAVVGKLLSSFGGESLHIIFLSIVTNYFRKSDKNAFGLNLAIAIGLFGYSLVKILSIILIFKIQNSDSHEVNVFLPSLIGFILSIASFCLSGFLILFENYWKKIMKKDIESNIIINTRSVLINDNISFLNEREIYPYSFWQAFQNMLNKKMIIIALTHGLMWSSFVCMISYNKFFVDLDSTNILDFQKSQDVFTLILNSIISIVMIFFIGNKVNNFRKKNIFMILGCLLNSFAYILYSNAYSSLRKNCSDPSLILFISTMADISLGIGMALFSAGCYASVPMNSNEKNISIAFGFIYSITNIFKFVLISITPSFAERQNNFFLGKNPFWMISIICMLLAILLEIIETNEKNKKMEKNIKI